MPKKITVAPRQFRVFTRRDLDRIPQLQRLAEDERTAMKAVAQVLHLVFIGFLLVMHRVLPGRHVKSSRLWPGVIVTTVLWVAAASVFSIYLSYTPSYTVTYGTLAGVIITLMFFYLTGLTIIFGAEVNAALNQIGHAERG